jgi:hypothetical protein
VGKWCYSSGPAKDDRDAAKGDHDDVAKGIAFSAAGGLLMPTPDIWLLVCCPNTVS